MKEVDCLIIGGGPAGLTAAIYLARFRRSLLVVDNDKSRANYIAESHNIPGIPKISGPDLLRHMREQAEACGATLLKGYISDLRKDDKGVFCAIEASGNIRAHQVLIASGIVDVSPNLPNLKELIYEGAVRFCPVCDGYEAMDKRVGIIGTQKHTIKKAVFMRTYTSDIFILPLDKDVYCDEDTVKILQSAEIAVPYEPVADIIVTGNGVCAVMASGARIELDILYPAMGAEVRSTLALSLQAKCNENGCLITNEHQRTNIPGLYAVGDITTDLSQISVGMGQAAIAATAMHNDLPLNPR